MASKQRLSGFEQSAADEHDIDKYTSGWCHAFAVALHRQFGWHLLVVLDPSDQHWEDPADADNFIAAVTHVYAVDPTGMAWDVLGRRPENKAERECRARGWSHVSDTDECGNEEGLRTYMGCWAEDGEEPIDRPLQQLDESDIKEAAAVAARVLAGMPGFPGMETVSRPGV